jgi:predicted Zn-dependent protease
MHTPRILALVFAACMAANSTAQSNDAMAKLQVLANSGRGVEALQQLETLVASQPELPGMDRVRGIALYNLNRFPEADKAFAAALIHDPHDEESAQMRGLTLYRLGKPADAIPLLEGASRDVQQKADPSYVLALCYMDTRRYDDARRAFAAQYNVAPESAAAYLLASRMLLRREYLPIAEQFAKQAVNRDPKLPLAHQLLGEIALAGNQFDVAQREFEQEAAANPLDPAPYERLGDILGRQGKYAAAQQSLQRAVLLEPNATGPYILLGRTSLHQGDAVAALTYLLKAESMDSSSAITHSLLAQTYRVMKRDQDAAKELEALRKLHASEGLKLDSLR